MAGYRHLRNNTTTDASKLATDATIHDTSTAMNVWQLSVGKVLFTCTYIHTYISIGVNDD